MAKRKSKEQKVAKTVEVTESSVAKKMVRVDDQIHAGFKKLAERNDRPMSREYRAAHIRHLKENGLWPVPPEADGR